MSYQTQWDGAGPPYLAPRATIAIEKLHWYYSKNDRGVRYNRRSYCWTACQRIPEILLSQSDFPRSAAWGGKITTSTYTQCHSYFYATFSQILWCCTSIEYPQKCDLFTVSCNTNLTTAEPLFTGHINNLENWPTKEAESQYRRCSQQSWPTSLSQTSDTDHLNGVNIQSLRWVSPLLEVVLIQRFDCIFVFSCNVNLTTISSHIKLPFNTLHHSLISLSHTNNRWTILPEARTHNFYVKHRIYPTLVGWNHCLTQEYANIHDRWYTWERRSSLELCSLYG